jgi:hypothetical protein
MRLPIAARRDMSGCRAGNYLCGGYLWKILVKGQSDVDKPGRLALRILGSALTAKAAESR